MKLIKSTIAILAIVSSSVTAWAGDVEWTGLGERLAQRNCSWCHGTSGQGFSTAPRLAGQTRQYIEKQLLSSKIHTRDNPKTQQFMWGAVEYMNADVARYLAVYYSSLNPKPANDGDERLAASGEKVYRDGNQTANIPACLVCHGPNAEGLGEVPRLGGMSYRYLKRRLYEWGEGYHATAAASMSGIASKLSPSDIDAIASYLSFVK